MNRKTSTQQILHIVIPALVLAGMIAACSLGTTIYPSPVLPTLEPTRQVATSATTVSTQITPIADTATPSDTPTVIQTPTETLTPIQTPTIMLTPTITLTPEPPIVTILDHIACWFGPGDMYLFDYGLNATTWMEVIGRNEEGTWLFIQGVHGWNPCWVRTNFVRFNDGGDVTTHNIPIVDPDVQLPYSSLYKPPDGVQAFRNGDNVTIYWNAVWMTEDDYEGYLVEAWVCETGSLVFHPRGYKPPRNQNTGTLGIIIRDEADCQQPSHARIYLAEKHGYTGYINIPWPAY
jgi:hypothetical protein